MFGLSLGHLLLFGVIVLVFVGPEQLPEVARNIARMINEIRRATSDFQSQFTGDFNMKKPWDTPLPPPVITAPPPPAPVAADVTTIAPAEATPPPVAETPVPHSPMMDETDEDKKS